MSVEDTVAPTRAERKKLLRSHPSHPRVLRRRVAALLIDLVALSYLQWLCGIVYGVVDPSLIRPLLYGDGILIKDASQPEVIWPVLLVITVVYFVAQEGLFATTLGKFLVGLRVTRMDGHRPKFVQILKRDIVRLVDQFPVLYLIGWLSVRSSPQGQRLGDRYADTLVVPAYAAKPDARIVPGLWWRIPAFLLGVAVVMAFSAEFFYYARPPLVVQNWVNAASVLPIGGVDPLAPHPCGAWQHDSAGNWTSPRYLTSYSIAGEGSQGHDPDGAPTLTYPIQFTVANGSSAYHGTITLRWNGLFGGGWQVESGETDC